MTEIHDLLLRAVDDTIVVDPTADLRRGRRALNRRRTRVAAGVTGGLVAAASAGYAALPSRPATVRIAEPMEEPAPALVHTTYFDFPTPPDGWHVSDANEYDVMISPDGTDPNPQIFEGQLMILLEDKSTPMDYGTQSTYDGRTFYDNEDSGDGYRILAVQDPAGDWIQLQYPKAAGFDTQAMIAFLDGVVVAPDAKGMVG